MKRFYTILLLGLCAPAPYLLADTDTNQPADWIDPDTGHRVIRVSTEPGSENFYFNVNAFTPDGKKMAFTAPSGIWVLDLDTLKIEPVVEGQHLRTIMVGRKTGRIFYSQRTNVYAADIESKSIQKIATFPRGMGVGSVNADETILAGTVILDPKAIEAQEAREREYESNADSERKNRARNLDQRFDRRVPVELFFYDLTTGKTKTFLRGNDWLNHFLFSPTDPHLLMFCHEGPWHKVNRIWTMRTDGSELTLVHKRTMAMEIAGHEFWGHDGQTIWYDLQTPRGEDFWVAGYNVRTGARTWYHLQRDEWSVHFNVSPDGKLFCGDGGDENMVAHADNGKWLYLFRPELLPDLGGPEIVAKNLIRPGVFHAEKLVNMAKHDYALEPNATFTPDMKWLVFRSNLSGTNQVYAVELKKAE